MCEGISSSTVFQSANTGDARLCHSSMTSRPTALKRPLHRPLALNHRGTSRPTKTYFGHRLGNSMPTKSTYRRCLRTFFCEQNQNWENAYIPITNCWPDLLLRIQSSRPLLSRFANTEAAFSAPNCISHNVASIHASIEAHHSPYGARDPGSIRSPQVCP